MCSIWQIRAAFHPTLGMPRRPIAPRVGGAPRAWRVFTACCNTRHVIVESVQQLARVVVLLLTCLWNVCGRSAGSKIS